MLLTKGCFKTMKPSQEALILLVAHEYKNLYTWARICLYTKTQIIYMQTNRIFTRAFISVVFGDD